MTATRQHLFSELIAAVFILLFAYTALDKFIHLKQFVFFLRTFSLFSIAPSFFAWAIVIAESVIVFLLLYSPLRSKGFLASFILMTGFTLFIAFMLLYSEKLPCSCGGILNKLSWRAHLIVNALLTALAFIGIRMHKRTDKKKYEMTT